MLTKLKSLLLIYKNLGLFYLISRIKDFLCAKIYEIYKNTRYLLTKPGGMTIKQIGDYKMHLNTNDFGIHRDLFLDGFREPVATDYLKKLLNNNSVALEIGANIGYYALIESRLCQKVYAVEPMPSNFDLLERNIKLNGINNIEIFKTAFSDTGGEKTLYVSNKSNWHSFYKHRKVKSKKIINTDTVDNFLKNKKKPTFVRMDIEGYEFSVLRGMKETLKQINHLFIELHADILSLNETRGLIDMLKQENFSPSLIVKYDRPKLHKTLSRDHLNDIYKGDKGNYEIFFSKK